MNDLAVVKWMPVDKTGYQGGGKRLLMQCWINSIMMTDS